MAKKRLKSTLEYPNSITMSAEHLSSEIYENIPPSKLPNIENILEQFFKENDIDAPDRKRRITTCVSSIKYLLQKRDKSGNRLWNPDGSAALIIDKQKTFECQVQAMAKFAKNGRKEKMIGEETI